MKLFFILCLSVVGTAVVTHADARRLFSESDIEGDNAVSLPSSKGRNLRTGIGKRMSDRTPSLSGQTEVAPKKDVQAFFYPSVNGRINYKNFRAENDSLLNDTGVATNNETYATFGVDTSDNETTSGALNETASEGFNETASGASNETASEGLNETVSEGSNETLPGTSNETLSEGFNETASEGLNETTSGGSNETVSEPASDEAAGILESSTPETVLEANTTVFNETGTGAMNETSEGGDMMVIIGAGNGTQEQEVVVYDADNALVINATDEFFDSEAFNVSDNQPRKFVDVIFYPSFDGTVTYHHMRTENETEEFGTLNEAFFPVTKKVEVIFYPAFEGTVRYNHLRTEGREVANSASCKPSSECYSDRDCGEGGRCDGSMLGKCDCGQCVSLRPCRGDDDCGGLHGACDVEMKMCNCHKGFASNGHGNDYFISVCRVMDCEPNTDSCFGLPCRKGSCSCM